jgi:NADH:ubiquinone oxidoreductase subunit 6 (subunit J)
MWALRYLFYRLYRWQVSCWNDEDVWLNALVLIVVLFCLNVVTLLALAESAARTSFLLSNVPRNVARIGIVTIGVLMALPLHCALVHKGKYKRIVREFESETENQRRIRGIGVSLYVVFSLLFLFAGAMLHGKIVGH